MQDLSNTIDRSVQSGAIVRAERVPQTHTAKAAKSEHTSADELQKQGQLASTRSNRSKRAQTLPLQGQQGIDRSVLIFL